MGCTSSKAAESTEAIGAASPVPGGRHQKDTAVLMCPYFKVAPSDMEAFSASCDAFYKSAVESDGVLFYGTATNEGGVHVRQGYRTADAMVAHLRHTEAHMSQTLKTAELEKVEVHGTRRQIMKVKSHTTTVGTTGMQFFETHPKMHSIRRQTAFTGKMGSDKLVSIHVALQISTVAELRTVEAKVKCVHRRACSMDGNESFFFSRCMEHGLAKIVATFDSMEAGMEHIACMAAHLGQESLRWLEMHGPEWELAKVEALLGPIGQSAEAAASAAADALRRAAVKAAEDAIQAKACAEAAAKAVAQKASQAVQSARTKLRAHINSVHQQAKAVEQQVCLNAMKLEGATEQAAKAIAKASYKRAVEAITDIRQVADAAAKDAYDEAISAGKSVEKALREADAEAHAAAKAALNELKELENNAEAALKRAKEFSEEGIQEAEAELMAIRCSVELGAHEVERVTSDAAKAVRRALFQFYSTVELDAVAACEAALKAVAAGEAVAEEVVTLACEKAKAAAYAVASTGEHVYLMAYGKALAVGKSAAEAAESAAKAAEYAAEKARDLWNHAADLCADAWKTAENMVSQGANALGTLLGAAATWVLDAARAIRKCILTGAANAAAMVRAGMLDFAWAVGAVVECAADVLESAVGVATSAANSTMHHIDHALTMIPHFAVPEHHQQDFKRACAGLQKASSQSSDVLFYGVCLREGHACIRHGYRSPSALVAYIHDSEPAMAEVAKYAKLQSVEVHGTRQHLMKVRKQVSKLSSVSINFYETDKKLKCIRRATPCSGEAGSDSMVTANLSINVTDALHKTLHRRVKAVHKAARDHPGVHHFSISRCVRTGTVKVMTTFTSVEAAVEHLYLTAAHLGNDALRLLEVHGPGAELDKIRVLIGSVGEGISHCVSNSEHVVKDALEAVEKKAEDDVHEAKTLAEAAGQAIELVASDAVKKAHKRAACIVEQLQTEAEAASQKMYKDVMTTEKGTEDYAKDLAKQSYKAAMGAYSDMRRAADSAAMRAYEQAMVAGADVEDALEDAHKAADAAASAMKEEVIDAADVAQADVEAARAGVKKKLESVAAVARVAAGFATQAVAAVASPASREARGQLLGAHRALKASCERIIAVHYTRAVHSEERIGLARERARAAGWSVVVTHQEAYLVAYERAVIEGKGAEDAREAACAAAGDAVGKAVEVWKQAQAQAEDALNAAKGFSAKGRAAAGAVFSSGVGFVLDAKTSLRRSLHSGVAMAEEELYEAAEDVSWAVGVVAGSLSSDIDSAHTQLSQRVKDWYNGFAAVQEMPLQMVTEVADSQRPVCCC